MTGSSGELINRYDYDPFGNIFDMEEQISNPYQYVGRWGVRRVSNIHTIHYMRARFYDSQHGRFLTVDPLGLGGKSENLYCYVNNNPIEMIDPKGTFWVFVFAGIGGYQSWIVYEATTAEVTVGEAVIAVGKGTIGGAVSIASKPVQFATSFTTGAGDELRKQVMSGKDVDAGEVAYQGFADGLLSLLPGELPCKCDLQLYIYIYLPI